MRKNNFFTKTLLRHKTSFGSIFLAGTMASYLALNHMSAEYKSRAVIEFPQNILLTKVINSIQSQERLQAVITQLDLENDLRFSSGMDTQSDAQITAHGQFKSLNVFNDEDATHTQAHLDTILSTLKTGLRVKPLETAGQIEISFTTNNPDLSAKLSNALASLEIENADYKKNLSTNIFSDLSNKIEAMQKDIAVLDNDILEKRSTFASANIANEYSYTQQLSSLQKSITDLNQKKSELGSDSKTNAVLVQLDQERNALLSRKKTLSKRYGEKHPKIIALTKNIAKNNEAIITAQNTLKDKSRKEQDEIESQLALLEIELGSIAPAAGIEKDVDLEKLEKLRADKIAALQKIMTDQTQNAKTLRESHSVPELVLAATPNDIPVTAKKPVLMAYAIGLLSFLGFAPGALIELRRRKFFQSADELENETGRPCVGRLALVDDFDNKPVADYILHEPHSQVSEAIKAIRMHLKLRSPNSEDGQVVMLSSTLAHEGKTTTALWLARQAAQAGMRTILVDANLRTPSIHKALQADNTASIVDVLTGRRLLDQCIRKDLKTGLHILLGSPAPNSAADLLSDKSLGIMLTSLRKNYDLIIIDTYAALSVADSRAVAPHADQILFIVRWNETLREFVHSTIKEISGFSTAPIATVLAGIDVEEQAKLGLGDVICTREAA